MSETIQASLMPGRRYRLTKDVHNPDADRRKRYDVAAMEWRSGSIFCAARMSEGHHVLCPVTIVGAKRRARGWIDPRSSAWESLIAALEPLQEEPGDVLTRFRVSGEEAIAELVRAGALSMDALTEACRQLEAAFPPVCWRWSERDEPDRDASDPGDMDGDLETGLASVYGPND